MLPESDSSRGSYVEMRDHRSRWRKMQLQAAHGDLDAFHGEVLESLAIDAEVPYLREVVDFAITEEILTPEMREAAENAIAWGGILRRLVLDRTAARGSVAS